MLPVAGDSRFGDVAIRFELPAAARVEAWMTDVAGRTIRILSAGGHLPAGTPGIPWNGRDASGRTAAAGVYFAHVRSTAGSGTARVVVVR
jgi:hypothetical protein